MKKLKFLMFSILTLGLCVLVNPNTVFAASCDDAMGSNKYSITTTEPNVLKYCASLDDAFSTVPENGTIQVLQPDTITALVRVSKSVTLDLNGKKLTVDRAPTAPGFQITNAAVNLTIKDSGSNGTITSSSSPIVLLAAGHLDLNGGILESTTSAAVIQIGHSSDNYTGSMTMNGGTVHNKSTDPGFAINIVRGNLEVNKGTIQFDGKSAAILVGDNDNTKGTLIFNGGTVKSDSVGIMIEKGNVQINNGTITATTDGYSAIQVGSSTSGTDASLEVTGGTIQNTNNESGNAILIAKSTATIKGGTIVSNSGSAAIQVGERTLMSAAHLVMTNGTVENKTSGPAILVTFAGTDANISGGTIKINEDAIDDVHHNDVAISIGLEDANSGDPGAKVTITDANIIGGIGLFGKKPELDFQGGTVTAKSFAVSGNGAQTQDSTIKISGGSLTSKNSAAIYHPQTGTLTITEGDITGKIGIVARQGEVEVTGGNINATGIAGENIRVGDSKDGDDYVLLPTGVAIIVDNSNKGGYADDADVTITGGDVNGDVESLLSYGQTTSQEKEFNVSGGKFNHEVETKYLSSNDYGQSQNGVVGKLHDITSEKTENGTVKVPVNAAEGETVTIEYTPAEGYTIDSIVVTAADGTNVPVIGNRYFIMPTGNNVTVKVTFKALPVDAPVTEDNPSTGDNVLTYVAMGMVTLVSTFGVALYLKRENA